MCLTNAIGFGIFKQHQIQLPPSWNTNFKEIDMQKIFKSHEVTPAGFKAPPPPLPKNEAKSHESVLTQAGTRWMWSPEDKGWKFLGMISRTIPRGGLSNDFGKAV